MVFAPKLSEGVAFNQPVQQPNAMEAIAGLFDFGVKVRAKEKENAPKPTEDEKFAVALRDFEKREGIGGSRDLDRPLTRQFIFENPQFGPQMKAHAENLGVMMTSPQEVARDATNEWFGSKEGMMAVAYASNLPEDEQEAYLSEQVTKAIQQEAKLAELERNNAIYAAEGTLTTKQWDIMKPTAKDMVDHTVGAVLNTIVTDVTNGLTIEVDPELKAMLGLRYDTISMNNLNAVLSDTKTHLETQFRKTYSGSFGQDMLPPDDWNKSVFASLDGLMKIGEAVKDPQARAATQRALIDSELYKTLDDNGVALVVRLAETIPPENLNRLIGDMANFDDAFAKALAGDGKIFNTAGIVKAVQDGSKTDAEAIAKDAIQTFEHGIVPEFFTAFDEARKRAGYDVVDGESFKKITGANIPEIIKLTSTNPDFRGEFGDFLTSDINKTVSIIKSNLPTEVSLTLNSKGQFSLVYTGNGSTSRAEAAMGADAFAAAEIKKAQEALPEGLNLTVLNEKIATLGLMGEFGKEIQGAIGITNKPEESTTKKNSAFGNGGRTTPRGRGGRVRDVGTELGIDFTGIERETGLPSGFLNTMAIIESGGDPNAKNDSSSAGGLFQQIDSNAAAYGVTDRFDPMQSTEGAVAFAQDNTVYLANKLGREPTGGELYLAHQQGPAGAARLLANPDSLAVDIVGEKAVKLNGGSTDMTAQEFANIWINKYDRIAKGGIGPAGAPVSVTKKDALSLPLGSASPDSQRASGEAPTASTTLSTGTSLTFDSPEVQQIVEKATSAPDEAIAMAKEVLTRPMDPGIKALIEALVKIGERA